MHTKENQFLYGASMAAACFLLVYLMLIFRFAPFGDEVWDWHDDNWGIYLAGGRYTVTLYRAIFSDCGVPVAYGIAASVFWGCAIAVQMEILKIQNLWLRFIYVAFSVGVVQLSYLMVCSFLVDAVCLGMLCCSLAYYLFEQWVQDKRKYKIILSVLLGVIGVGSYQFLFVLFLVLFSAVTLQYGKDKMAALVNRALLFGGWCCAVLIFYFVVAKTGKLFCSAEDLAITESYQSTLITWGKLDLITHVLHIGKQWVMHLLGTTYPGEWVYTISLVALFFVVRDIYNRVEMKDNRIVCILLAVGLYVLPFLPITVLGEDQGTRLFLSQSTACAILCFLALAPRVRYLPKWAIAVCGCFIILKASYVVSDAAFYQKRRYEQTLVLRNQLYARIMDINIPAEVDVSTCPIVVQGSLVTPLVANDIYGSVVPTVGTIQLEQYLDTHTWGRADKRDVPLMREFQDMPAYPASGSIRYWNGKILVKLR